MSEQSPKDAGMMGSKGIESGRGDGGQGVATPCLLGLGALRHSEWCWLGAILALGAVLRVWYLLQVVHAPDFEALRQDLDVQDYHARAMATGDWTVREGVIDPQIRTTPYYRPPGYPYYLAIIYFFTGGSYLAPRIVNTGMGLAAVILMFLLGRSVYGRSVGLIAAFFMATYWGFLYFEGEVNDPVVFVFLVPCLMHVLRLWGGKMSLRWAALAGAIVGCYALARPNILLFGPVIAGWMLYMARRRGRLRGVLPSWCGLGLATFLVIMPVTVRNYVVSGEFVPISTYFGENFLIGNGEDSDGYTSWTPYLQELEGTGSFSVWIYPNIVAGLGKELGIDDLKHSEASRVFFWKTVDFIKDHKLRTLKLLGKKLVLFWSPLEVTGNKVVQYEKEHYTPLKYLPGFAMVMGLWLTGAALFVADLRRGRVLEATPGSRVRSTEMSFLFFSFILVYFASFLPFFVNGRARVPITSVCFLIGAYGLYRIGQFAAAREFGKAGVWLGVFAVLCLLASIQYIPYEPDRARWRYGRADSYLRVGEVEKALDEANRMLALPRVPMTYMPYRLGHGFAKLGRHEAAVRLLRAALGPNPEEQSVHYRQDLCFHIGFALAELGKLDEAVAEFEQAIRLNPDDPRSHNDLALVLERQGKTAEAAHHFEEALRASPDFDLAHSNLGHLLGRLGQHEQALEHFRKAVEAKPDNPDYHYNLALHLAQTGRTEEAVEQYETAIELGPGDPRPHNNLGLLFAERGQDEAAIGHYAKALAVAPDFTLAYANWGNLLVARGRFERGIAIYQLGLDAYPNDAGLHNGIGYQYAQHGDTEKALHHYREAVRIAPSFAKAHTNLAHLLAAQGDLDGAIEHYGRAAEAGQEDPHAYFNLGNAWAHRQEWERAAGFYRRALEIAPDHVAARCNLGAALENMGRTDEACDQFVQVLQLEPNNEFARRRLDLLRAEEGRPGNA